MWSSRLFWKLFFAYVGLSLALTAGFLAFGMSSQRREIYREVERRLFDSAVVLRSHVEQSLGTVIDKDGDPTIKQRQVDQLQSLITKLAGETETRMTLIDGQGNVIAESDRDPTKLLGHENRPEILAALESGKGVSQRLSPTLQTEMYYLALPVETSSGRAVVRVAIQMETIHQRISAVRRFLYLLAFGFVALATGLTYWVVGRIVRPLAQLADRAHAIASGSDEVPVPIDARDEVGQLSESFNQMQSQLTKRFYQLRENNEQMSTVLASMDEGLIAVDANENILLANDASMRLLGFEMNAPGARPLLEVVRNRALYDVVRQCLQSGQAVQTEFEVGSDSRRELSVRAASLPRNPAPGALIVLRDISELRRLENLRQEFVANVSHELKTPLASIKAYSETLRLGAIDDVENRMRFVDEIQEQAERLHQLILDMLQIAQVESGETAFEIVQVPVGRIVDSCVKQNMGAAQRKQIELLCESDSPLCVQADEDGLRAIIDNLVTNAIKYTPQGGQVLIRWYEEGEMGILEVQDTGIGIAAKDQTRIFERFFRVDKARSREMGGTGLGLSIVKHLCQSFGGSVELVSELGEGASFRVKLPLV